MLGEAIRLLIVLRDVFLVGNISRRGESLRHVVGRGIGALVGPVVARQISVIDFRPRRRHRLVVELRLSMVVII